MSDQRTLVEIDGLTIGFPNRAKDHITPVVRDVSFTIRANEILGLVGESGSGKTQTSMSLLGLTRPPGKVMAGAIRAPSSTASSGGRAASRANRPAPPRSRCSAASASPAPSAFTRPTPTSSPAAWPSAS